MSIAPYLHFGTNHIHVDSLDLMAPVYGGGDVWLYLEGDTIPPVISNVQTRQDGAGETIIMATITDNVAVAGASVFWNGQEYQMQLDPTHADRYYVIIPQQLNGSVGQFTITAVDPAGNSACWPAGCTPDQIRTVYSHWLALAKNTLIFGEPVNTATGSFFTQHQDVYAPAPGIPSEFKRTYNSMAGAVDGPLGFGWTHGFNMWLEIVDDPLLHGVVVHYADGHIANFTDNGSGYDSPPGDLNSLMHEGSGFVLAQPDQIKYHFDAGGRLTSVSDRNDNTEQLTYTGSNLTQITDTAGRIYLLEYTGSRIAKIMDVLGRTYEYTYDGDGNLITYKDPEGGLIQYTYDSEHWMLSITDPNGHVFVTNTYDARGRVIAQKDASNNTSTFSYPDEFHAILMDNEGKVTTHTYDAEHRIVDNKDAYDRSITYEYDANNLVIRTVDRGDHDTAFTYDGRGNMLTRTNAEGKVATFQYDAQNNVTSKQDEAGAETRYEYDARGNLLRKIDALGGITSMTYDSRGLILTRTDPNGHTTSYEYDAQGNPITAQDPLGIVTHNEYDAMGRRIAMTDGNGHTARFYYDGNDRLVKTVDPKGKPTIFTYDPVGNLLSVTDRRGFTTSNEYNENDSLIKVTDPRGNFTTYTYDRMYHRTSTTNRRGFTTSYQLDDVYNVVRTTDPKGNVTAFAYDTDGNLIASTDALGNATQFEYDALHRLIKMTNALGGVTEYTYDPVGRLLSLLDPKGGVTASEYDQLGRLLKLTDALLGVTSYTYDAAGNRLSTTNPRGFTTQYAYDPDNRLIQQIDPLGHTQQFAYDGVGNITLRTDARGNTTTFRYDENDNLVQTVDALGGQMLYAYDEENSRISVTDQNGHTTMTEYDALAEPVRVTQPLLQQTGYEYDQNGNLISVTNAKGKKTALAYDATDLLTSRTDPLGSVTGYQYDALGRLVQVTDAEGNSMQNRYDALSRLVEVIDAMNGHTTYKYDALGNLTAFTDANMHRTSFDVDLLGRTTGEHNPLGSAWQYQFDAAGNLIQRTDAKGVVTQYTYDADNRLAHTAYPSGPAVDMGYDANDNLVNVTDGSGAAAFAYDALNRLTRIQRTAGILATKTLQYSYDAAGNRTGVTYPGGQAVSYAFNANNWLVTATDPIAGATQYTYDPVGLPILEQNPNGTKTEYAYDDADRLVKLFNLKPQTSTDVISSFEYTLDRVGNRVQTIEKATSGQLITWTENYAYDKLYRLTKAVELPNYKSAQPYTSEFVYDAVGNRLSLSTNIQDKPNTPPLAKPVITNYTYNAANQMLTAGNTTFSYDANGNRVTMAGPTTAIDYVYDFENRLAGAQTFNILKGKRQKDSVLDFIYDGLGRRLERGIVESGVRKTAEFLYDGLGYDLLAQYVQPNNPNETLYFRDQTRMLSRYEIGGANHWYGYAHDGLDSVSGWSNINGASVQEYKYAPYGRLIDNNGPDNTSNQTSPQNTVTFSGKVWDKEMGTYYFGARDYDPSTGTWLTQDPYRGPHSRPAALHRYMYADDSPITLVDRNGLYSEAAPIPPLDLDVKIAAESAQLQPGTAGLPTRSANSSMEQTGDQLQLAGTSNSPSLKSLSGGTLRLYIDANGNLAGFECSASAAECEAVKESSWWQRARDWILEKSKVDVLWDFFADEKTGLLYLVTYKYVPEILYNLNPPRSPIEYRLADISKAANASKIANTFRVVGKILFWIDVGLTPLRYSAAAEAEKDYQDAMAKYGEGYEYREAVEWNRTTKWLDVPPIVGVFLSTMYGIIHPKPCY